MGDLAAELLEPAAGVAVLVLHGSALPIDADDLRESVRVAGEGRRALVVDLTAFATDDAAIVEALLDAQRDGRVDQRSLQVVLPAAHPLAAILRTSGLGSALRVHPTRAAALAAVGVG